MSEIEVVHGELVEDIEITPSVGPLSPEERAQVVRWIGQGVTRNEIARRTGRGVATITRVAQREGLRFTQNDMMRPAKERESLDLRAKRLKLRDLLLEDAFRLREQLWKPTMLYFVDYKSARVIKQKIKEPQAKDKRDLATSIGILVDKVSDLERLDAPQEGRQAIAVLVDNLRLNYAQEIHNHGEESNGSG